MKQHIVFDCEIIGEHKPVFLVCTKNLVTGCHESYWYHKKGHILKLQKALRNPEYTWVSFNGINFDAPLICAAIQYDDILWLKKLATRIIDDKLSAWHTYRNFSIDPIDFDHIDLIEVAPGIMTSLKTYAGRMDFPTMSDLPFQHNQDLERSHLKTLEAYCINDLLVTQSLFEKLTEELRLREELGKTYGIDLRSKSNAQIAEAVLKKQLGIVHVPKSIPKQISYTTPDLIHTTSRTLNALILRIESSIFPINPSNGSPEAPEWMSSDITLNGGTYKLGIGGLHSTHDCKLYRQARNDYLISDFDAASYYPNLMLTCGLLPHLPGGLGKQFIETYRAIYTKRMDAKKSGDKVAANSLKIILNGTFGKLGSIYSVFYSPDVMLAVTITGQLNLLCLIDELSQLTSVTVLSANTDGIIVGYPEWQREAVVDIFKQNSDRTTFEYEETKYKTLAMKDVNNYIAITTNNDVKRKGLYAKKSLTKNPTMPICSEMAIDWLTTGNFSVTEYCDPTDFVAVRTVNGGGVQHKLAVKMNNWEEINDGEWTHPMRGALATIKRKSKPPPYMQGVGGEPFGRVARWYMSTSNMQPITYVTSGNKVPKTEGARLCMTLPDTLPTDVDLDWYERETLNILKDIGVIT